MILSESEKNRIKGLYGLITESETVPPPNERELVVRDKNPFKYTEYEDARREYSADLKDGDRFYVSKELGPFMGYLNMGGKPYNTFYDVELFYPIFKDLVGKTIRALDKDEIKQIKKIHVSKDSTYCEIYWSDSVSEKTRLVIDINGDAYNKTSIVFTSEKTELSNDELNHYSSLIKYVVNLLKELKTKLEKFSNKDNWAEIPDIYFDIYKVKRQQTDF